MIAGNRARAARVALAVAGMLAATAAGAADYRIGPTPAWVRPVPFDSAAHPQADAANVAYGARYDLIDDQVRLAANSRARFHHVVSEADHRQGHRRPEPSRDRGRPELGDRWSSRSWTSSATASASRACTTCR